MTNDHDNPRQYDDETDAQADILTGGVPDWYHESYVVELSPSTLDALDACLSARISESGAGTTQYAVARTLRSRVRDVDHDSPKSAELPGLSVSGKEFSNLYGVLYTHELGSTPDGFDADGLRLDEAKTEMRDHAPDALRLHIERVTDGLETMLEYAADDNGGETDD